VSLKNFSPAEKTLFPLRIAIFSLEIHERKNKFFVCVFGLLMFSHFSPKFIFLTKNNDSFFNNENTVAIRAHKNLLQKPLKTMLLFSLLIQRTYYIFTGGGLADGNERWNQRKRDVPSQLH
jgi:hypothetical protein